MQALKEVHARLKGGQSTDESGSDDLGTSILRSTVPIYRSLRLAIAYGIYEAAANKYRHEALRSGHLSHRQGVRMPRVRGDTVSTGIPSGRIPDLRSAPCGLPKQLYNRAWYKSLDEAQRYRLAATTEALPFYDHFASTLADSDDDSKAHLNEEKQVEDMLATNT